MHCKKCDAVFFMDKSGKIMLGDPDKINARKNKAIEPKQAKKKADYETPSIGTMLLRMPKQAKVALLLVALASLAYATGMHRRIRLPTGVPKSLLGRAEYAMNVFADDAPDRMKAIIVPGTEDALRQWFELLRPAFKFKGPQDERSGKVCLQRASSVKEDGSTAHLILHVMYPSAIPIPDVEEQRNKRPHERKLPTDAGYKHSGDFDLPTYWVKQGDTWQLDMAKTLDFAQNPGTKPAT
jgi:hypothetical protein